MNVKPVPVALILATLLTTLLVALPGGAEAGFGSPRRHVLLLHSYHKGMRWVDDITDSFTATLKSRQPDVEFHVEYMDTKREVDGEHLENLYREYRYKFRRQKFDLVATADDAAIRFALQHQDHLFPGAPIVFCGVNNFEPWFTADRGNVTGVLEDVDVAETLAVALSLHPKTRKVFIVNDRSETGKGLHREIAEAISRFPGIEFTFLEDRTIAQLAALERELPPGSIILRSAFFIDGAGRTIPDEVASIAAVGSHASVPVYSFWDYFLGFGITGGKLVSGKAQGELTAQISSRILNGERPGEIPVVTTSPNRMMFDYRQLKRFGVSRSDLPPGSIVINEPQLSYAVDKPLLWAGWIFTVIVTITSLLLILAIRRRRLAEALLRASHNRILEQQEALATLTRNDVFATEDLAAAVRCITEAGARQLAVARASVWLFNEGCSVLRCIDLFEAAPGSHSSGAELATARYPVYFAALVTEEVIAAGDARNNPLTAEFRDDYLVPLGITSMLDVPVRLHGLPAGVLCIEHIGPAITWSPEARFFAIALANLVSLAVEQDERRKGAALLRTAEAKFRDLFHSAGDAIVIHTADGTILEVNRRMCERLEYRRDELVGTSLIRIEAPEYAAEVPERREILRAEGIAIFETEHLRKDGTRIPVEVNSRVTDYEGWAAVMSVVRNITGRRDMERMKDEMLSAVSHELRTPLAAIMGYTSFLLENRTKANEREECLRTVYSATMRLDLLVDDFLELQRLKAFPGKLDVSPVPLSPLLSETAALYARVSPDHTLVTDFPHDLEPVAGDVQKLRQVLINLLSNAFKYSPDGGRVFLAARREGEEIAIVVSDEGIGIPLDAQELIFDRFFRVDNTDRRRVGGTGLGLALVREIVRAHQGRVWVESTLGAGSTFYVALPVWSSGEAATAPLP